MPSSLSMKGAMGAALHVIARSDFVRSFLSVVMSSFLLCIALARERVLGRCGSQDREAEKGDFDWYLVVLRR